MHWLKRDMWNACITIAGLLFILIFIVWLPLSVDAYEGSMGTSAQTMATVQATPTPDLTVTVLTKQKLQDDVDQRQHTFANLLWNNAAAVLSTLVIVVGALIGLLRWSADRRNAIRLAEMTAEATAQTEREIVVENQRESSLQTYIDKMSELLLVYNLRTQPTDEVREIARVRTLTLLPQLDAVRKKSVLRFLYEADLIHTHNTIIDLSYTKLDRADLHRATFTGINLKKSNLRYADLTESELQQANLSGAKLEGANLTRANLAEANLSEADLNGIRNLEEVLSLDHADLRRVKGLTKEQLEFCKTKGAIVDEATSTNSPESTNSLLASEIAVNSQSPSTSDENSNISAQPSVEP